MSRYDGLIIPRSYSEYINKTDAATLLQALQLSGVMDNAPTANSNHPTKSSGVYTALAGKQATLTFDNTPTANSNNPVKSGGIYTELQLYPKMKMINVNLNSAGWYRIAEGMLGVTGLIAEVDIATSYNYNRSAAHRIVTAAGFGVVNLVQLVKSDEEGEYTKIRAYQAGSNQQRSLYIDVYYAKTQTNPAYISITSQRNTMNIVTPTLVTIEPPSPTVLDI